MVTGIGEDLASWSTVVTSRRAAGASVDITALSTGVFECQYPEVSSALSFKTLTVPPSPPSNDDNFPDQPTCHGSEKTKKNCRLKHDIIRQGIWYCTLDISIQF